MSIGTLVLGLLLALFFDLDAAGAPQFAVFGWLLVGLGAIGIVVRLALPPAGRRRTTGGHRR
jgi:hypothetical protein